jgi:hypothetical protein
MSTLTLRCRCARVHGVAADASRSTGNRLVCYCDDCQLFVRFLGRPDVLDAAGGTDIYQMAPARLQITEGHAALRCVRLFEKGLYRWYTDCCRTPIANTVGPRVPFVGLIASFIEGDARSVDDALGKPLGLLYERCAIGEVPPQAIRTAQSRVIARCVRMMVGWWVTGKGSPSPFFDPRTRAPVVAPRTLGASDREALRR